MAAGIASFEDDHSWVDANRDELIRDYPSQWIAVRGGRVVSSHPDLDALLSKLSDAAHTAVEFVSPEQVEVVL